MKRMKLSVLSLVILMSMTLLAQQPVNNAQTVGATTLTGNGLTGAGSQRVTIASDNTAFSVNATLSAETTKVIGEVNQGTSPWVTNTSQINGVTPLMGNGITGTGSLRVTIASDNTAFSVNASLAAETTKVIGTVRNVGNVGGIFDFAGQNAAQPANSILIGGEFNTSPTTITTGNASPLQLDSAGKLLVNCTGCSAGSTVALIPQTSGGLTPFHLVAAATNNATAIKGSAGQIYGVSVYNNTTYPVYVKFCNKATACTCGTNSGSDTILYTVAAQAGTEREVHSEIGIPFSTGIGMCAVKGITDTDNTSLALSDAVIDALYK